MEDGEDGDKEEVPEKVQVEIKNRDLHTVKDFDNQAIACSLFYICIGEQYDHIMNKLYPDTDYRGNSGLSRLSGANPDAGRPFPGPFWDVKALKNPPPTPGLNSSLKKHTSNPKMQLRTRGGFLNLKSKLHLSFTNVPLAVH